MGGGGGCKKVEFFYFFIYGYMGHFVAVTKNATAEVYKATWKRENGRSNSQHYCPGFVNTLWELNDWLKV